MYGLNALIYNRRILGDATGEMGPFQMNSEKRFIGSWYKSEAKMVYSTSPWFRCGGSFSLGTNSGIFSFFNEYGRINSDTGFRVVLVV